MMKEGAPMKKKLFVFGLLLISLLCVCSAALAEMHCTICASGILEATSSSMYGCNFKCNYCGASGGTSHGAHEDPCECCGRILPCQPAYIPNGDGTHALVCTFVKDGVYPENCTLKPGAVADEECDAGWATCTEPARCLDCKATVGEIDPDNHSWGNWKDDGNGNHVRVCWRNSAHVESRPHTGGTANCVEQAVCDECHLEYGSVDLTAHDWGEWTTEDETNHSHSCTRENCDAKEETEKHDFDFNCTASGVCSACGYVKQAQEHIPGPAATCTTAQVCIREGCGAVIRGRSGHDYKAVVTEPSCLTDGYTTHTCENCGDAYTDAFVSAKGHVYGQWTAQGDGTHSAACKRCPETLTVECTLYLLEDKTVCPVCGEYGEGMFPAVNAAVQAVEPQALPRHGELIVRLLEKPVESAECGITVAWEAAGKVLPFEGTVSVSLPLQAEGTFKLMQNGAEIPFTLENGMLIFQTAEAGLFLLVAGE